MNSFCSKIILLCLFFLLTVFAGCSRSKVTEYSNKTLLLRRESKKFQELNRRISRQRVTVQKEISDQRSATVIEDVERTRFNPIEHNRQKVNIDQIRGVRKISGGALSFDAEAVIVLLQEEERVRGRTIEKESVVLHSMKSGISEEIYTYETSPEKSFLSFFPSVAWDPYSNSYAFIARDNGYSEVFVGFYNDQYGNVLYDTFKITGNQEKHITFFDVTWSPSGDRIAFSEFNENEGIYYVRVFNLVDQRWDIHNLGENAACFRFCTQNDNGAFYAKKTRGLYYPYYTQNYSRSDGNMLMEADGLSEPLFAAQFSQSQPRVAYSAIEKDSFRIDLVSFDSKNPYHVLTESFDYRDEGISFLPNHGPLWALNDNFLITHNILHHGTIYTAFVNEVFMNIYSESDLLLSNFISNPNLWYTNSLSCSSDGKTFLFAGYDNSTDERRVNFFLTSLDIEERLIPLDELKTPHRTNISFVRTTEEGEKILQLTQKRRARRGTVVGYITALKEFYYDPEIGEQSFIEGGKNFIIEWPASINQKTIEVSLKEADRDMTRPDIRD
jgi:hypothetical protein